MSLGKPDNRISAEPKRKSAAEKRINSFKRKPCGFLRSLFWGKDAACLGFFFGCWVHGWGLGISSADVPFLCLFTVFGHLPWQWQWSVIPLPKLEENFSPLKQPKCRPSHRCWAHILKLVVLSILSCKRTAINLFFLLCSPLWIVFCFFVEIGFCQGQWWATHPNPEAPSTHYCSGMAPLPPFFLWELNCKIMEPTVHDQPKDTE